MTNIFFYDTEIGRLGIAEGGGAITNLYLSGDAVPADAVVCETELLREAGEQLLSYFSGGRRNFTIPLSPDGTQFMQSVWMELRKIPYGQTRSYQEVARRMGNKDASRAVGQACKRNPIPIFIHCHRVIGADGRTTGYRGGIHIKTRLLELEKRDGDLRVRRA
ncbi:MAG: Methylated-DNA--protein-cysteine methyltransferase [Methanosaeta sp. PtaB.Bin039]|nr:MAG: Methylated-DNA--protein-cysteine methyltransferase [Methanosaeta sp. PtaB.Bin039]OPY47131.1 MAG: Methylated-DNA--protein-cysteine methyltransferase [Methanosaeta sp. PtaU1.Bin028]